MADVIDRVTTAGTTPGKMTASQTKYRDKHPLSKPQTMRHILHSSKPPFTIELCRGNLDKYRPLRPSDGKAVRFKVTEIRRKKNVLARKMQWDRQSEDYVPTGSQLEIPSTYKGWFEVLPDDGRPVEYFDTIYGITSVKPRRFLVRTSTVGYQLTVDEAGSSWTPCEIRPGEVLTTGIVYNDQKKHKASTNMKNLFKRILRHGRFGKKDNDLRYLQCFDAEGKEIMIPLIMSGVFSPIGDITETNYDAVYDLQDMLLAFSLPVKVQLVHGNPKQKQVVPNGVLRIEGARDQEYAIVKLGHPKYASEETFELPVDCDLLFLKEDIPKPKKAVPTGDRDDKPDNPPKTEDVHVVKDISLPVRVPNKDNRKLKGSIILEKLSGRKSKKERASLKALQEEGVFSSRLSKQDLTYDDFFYKAEEENDNEEESTVTQADTADEPESTEQATNETPSKKTDPESGYAVVRKRQKNGETTERPKSIQERTLPPIPVENSTTSEVPEEEKPALPKTAPPARPSVSHPPQANSDLDDSSETLYEKLPPAPKPPTTPNQAHPPVSRQHSKSVQSPQEDDGYLIPAEARSQYTRSPCGTQTPDEFYVPRRLPRGNARDEKRALRSQRSRSEYGILDADCPIDIDDLFDFGAGERGGMYGEFSGPADSRTLTRSHAPNIQRLAARELSALSHPGTSGLRFKSMSHRNLSVDPNATIRSHNMKKLRTALELFNFSDSFMDLRDERAAANADAGLPGAQLPRDPSRFAYSPRREEEDAQRHFTGRDSGIGGISYAESEPGYRHYQRSYSVTGLSDTYAKNGDDSAISLCSRGDYGGFNAESEYSYTGYHDPRDDGWVPPDDLHALTVPEVSKSLRYIGMKDRVVIRFAQEQIDGNMLCSLDHRLLQEGFPELNMLEIKKIVDFLNGWRPKK